MLEKPTSSHYFNRETSLIPTAEGAMIPVPNLSIEGYDKTGSYRLVAREVQPTQGKADTMIILTHGGAPNNEDPNHNSNPIQLYEDFQNRFADAGFATVVFHTRGVGKMVKINETVQYTMQSDRDYFAQSLNDRVDDLVTTLMTIESSSQAPKRYILAGLSMGADTTMRALQKLVTLYVETSQAPQQAQQHTILLRLIEKIQGYMLLAPAAYLEEFLGMAAGDPEKSKGFRESAGRLQESPIFQQILTDNRLLNPGSLYARPLFVAGWTDDTLVKEAQQIYETKVLNPSEDTVRIPGTRHEGLISPQTAQDYPQLYEKLIGFANRIASNTDEGQST